MAKFKFKEIVKWYNGEKYKFVGGVAKVPGMRHRGPHRRPYVITIKEFKELSIL